MTISPHPNTLKQDRRHQASNENLLPIQFIEFPVAIL